MNFYIQQIIENKQRINKVNKKLVPLQSIIDKLNSHPVPPRNFKQAVTIPDKLSIIGELKRASPSKGLIRKEFNIEKLTETYVAGNVSAISVLTAEYGFLGSLSYLKTVHDITDIPVLRKDFIIDDYQIYESLANYADAILLIVSILSLQQLKDYYELAAKLGLYALVEIHNETELNTALSINADIIGINSRNLDTFKINTELVSKLKPLIPVEKTVIAESGIKTRDELARMKQSGINAALIGETFMRSSNLPQLLKEFVEI